MATHIISTKLAGCSGVRPPRFGDVVAVVAGGLVAVMAVGDEDRLRPDQAGQGGDADTSVTGQSRLTTPR